MDYAQLAGLLAIAALHARGFRFALRVLKSCRNLSINVLCIMHDVTSRVRAAYLAPPHEFADSDMGIFRAVFTYDPM